MSLEAELLLGCTAMIALVALRLARARLGRSPFPDGRGQSLLVVAFLFVPPIAADWLIDPVVRATPLFSVAAVPLYLAVIAVVAVLMNVIVRLDTRLRPGHAHRWLRVALLGRDDDPDYLAYDPPVTGELAPLVVRVERSNAAFPRGAAFPEQVDRPGFRAAWDALDGDTTSLEQRLVSERQFGRPVPSEAVATAADARSRLETLRYLARASGQAWSTDAGAAHPAG